MSRSVKLDERRYDYMEDNKTTVEKAIELFEQQKYREAFAAFAEIYDQSQDKNERKAVFDMLVDSFYAPNEEEFQTNYKKNLSVLKQYPYFWGKEFHEYEELAFRLFPISDELFYCYNKEKDCFEGEYDAATCHQMRYFFEHVDEQLKVENEDNFYNLNFLNDNVRASEDYAGDNHIYLFYDTLKPLERLMLTCDLETVLRDKKFVFLVGGENKKRYPVDFLKEFQINYASLKPAPVRIEEIKRVCFWYKHAHSGTMLSLTVLGSLNEVQMYCGHDFNAYAKVNEQPLVHTEEFRDAVTDVDAVFTAEQISDMLRSEKYELRLEEVEGFVDWLFRHRPAPHAYTVKELFCGYFLFKYEKRHLNPRIAPMLLYDPHMWNPGVYSNIILSFPYHTALTCVREPIMTFIRCQQIGVAGYDEGSTRYLLAFDYLHAQFLHQELQTCYYGFRFEDLKTKPEIVCRALCKHLNLPYDKIRLKVDAPADRPGVPVRGFDLKPLSWDLSACLSEFDKVRLQMFYEPIQRYYGYPTFSFEEHPLPENLVRELFEYPFRFENVNPKIYREIAPDPDIFHAWIQDVLQNNWRKEFVSPKLIPLEDLTDPEQATGQNMQKRQTAAHTGSRQERRMQRRKK